MTQGTQNGVALPEVGTVELIMETARQAAGAEGKVEIIDLPEEPPGTYAIVKPDGAYDIRRGKPGDRLHQLSSIDEVGAFAGYVTRELTGSGDPTVWIARNQIVVLLDEERRDRAVCPIRKTKQWRWLADKAASEAFDQKKFIRLLRVFLADCLDEDGTEAIRILRAIEMKASTTAHGTVERGRESMGRDIEAEVRSAAGELPETITLEMQPIDDPAIGRRWKVRCALEIDVRDATFQLIPLAGQLEAVRDEALARVREIIEGESSVPVFYGSPEGDDGEF